MAALLKLPPVALSLVSAYGLFHSYQSIIRLREYEETTKKAAKYSNTAADQLFKTRTTQGSAAVSILVAFLSSAALIFASSSPTTTLVASAVNVAATLATRVHVKGFWAHSVKVPGVKAYNEAISGTEELIKVLSVLGGVWLVEMAVAGVRLLSVGRAYSLEEDINVFHK